MDRGPERHDYDQLAEHLICLKLKRKRYSKNSVSCYERLQVTKGTERGDAIGYVSCWVYKDIMEFLAIQIVE